MSFTHESVCQADNTANPAVPDVHHRGISLVTGLAEAFARRAHASILRSA